MCSWFQTGTGCGIQRHLIMLKISLSICLLLALAVATLFYYKALKSRSGAAPGLVSGRLTECPSSPNCICSEYPDDTAHYAAPIALVGEPGEQLAVVKAAIEAQGGEVVVVRSDYLAATFTSGFFGFVDDLEVRLDESARLLHLRSASRVGHSDLGANRKRVAALKAAL